MDRENAEKLLLDHLSDENLRAQLTAAMRQLQTDEELSAAVRDYMRIQELLATNAADAVPHDGWDAFEERLQSAAQRSLWTFRLHVPLAAAAVLLLAAVVWWQLPRPAADAGIGTNRWAQLGFAPAEIQQNVTLFREVADFFDQRASWVSLSDEATGLGLAPEQTSTSKLLLLRLAVIHQGAIVSRAELAIVPGRPASLVLPIHTAGRLEYSIETSPGEPASLSLSATLHESNGKSRILAALSTSLALAGEGVMPAGELTTASGQYSLQVAYALVALGTE